MTSRKKRLELTYKGWKKYSINQQWQITQKYDVILVDYKTSKEKRAERRAKLNKAASAIAAKLAQKIKEKPRTKRKSSKNNAGSLFKMFFGSGESSGPRRKMRQPKVSEMWGNNKSKDLDLMKQPDVSEMWK